MMTKVYADSNHQNLQSDVKEKRFWLKNERYQLKTKSRIQKSIASLDTTTDYSIVIELIILRIGRKKVFHLFAPSHNPTPPKA